jgi:hypothetical protein
VELLAILRLLRRDRVAVAAGAVLALVVAVHGLRGGGASHSGLAWTRVVLDTPKSELVSPAPAGADSLEWRAGLLAELTLSDPVRQQIARNAGIRADDLATVMPDLGAPVVAASMPQRASDAANVVAETNVLTVRTQELPIISIQAAAPEKAAAVRLADAAVRALEQQATPVATRETQGLLIERAAPTRAKEVVDGKGRALALGMAVFFFGFWCAGVLVLAPVVRALRAHGRTPAWASRKIPALSAVEFETETEREGARMTHARSFMTTKERP